MFGCVGQGVSRVVVCVCVGVSALNLLVRGAICCARVGQVLLPCELLAVAWVSCAVLVAFPCFISLCWRCYLPRRLASWKPLHFHRCPPV